MIASTIIRAIFAHQCSHISHTDIRTEAKARRVDNSSNASSSYHDDRLFLLRSLIFSSSFFLLLFILFTSYLQIFSAIRSQEYTNLTVFSDDFMKNSVPKNLIDVNYQLRDFLRTDHKFADLIFVDIKSFIIDIINQNSSSITSKSIRTRREQFIEIEKNRWSDSWAVDRFEFRKAIIFYEKIFDLSSSFVFRHFRESFKNFFSNQFVNLRLQLPEKFFAFVQSFDLTNLIVNARNQTNFSSLTSVSSTSLSSDNSVENFVETTTSIESLNMSDFEAEFSNQNRSNIALFSDVTSESTFSAAQRSKIADIVATAVRTIHMQQFISSLITEIRSQDSTHTDFIKEWTVDDIRFFDSNIDDDDSIVNVSRHVFYKNIYVFVDRLKDMIVIRENDKFRIVLSQCFRDAALI